MPLDVEAGDKRTKLVSAARELLYRHGMEKTTLAHVADLAKVPLGNVYYYFKTKDALTEAVIAAHESALKQQLSSFVRTHQDPRLRLRALVRGPLGYAKSVVRFGCPHGSLCQELEKLAADAPLAKSAARLLAIYIDWAAERFREAGLDRRAAQARAVDLVASLQGAMLVAHTLRSADVLKQQLRRVERALAESFSEPKKRNRPS